MDTVQLLYHFLPPTVGSVITIVVGYYVRKSEIRQRQYQEEDQRFKADIKTRITTIRRQNGWLVRKFVELGSTHNIQHPDSRINIDNMPDDFPED